MNTKDMEVVVAKTNASLIQKIDVKTFVGLYDHKTNNSIGKELRITSILDKTDEYRKKYWQLLANIGNYLFTTDTK